MQFSMLVQGSCFGHLQCGADVFFATLAPLLEGSHLKALVVRSACGLEVGGRAVFEDDCTFRE